jgi:hypothetical protein
LFLLRVFSRKALRLQSEPERLRDARVSRVRSAKEARATRICRSPDVPSPVRQPRACFVRIGRKSDKTSNGPMGRTFWEHGARLTVV